MNEAKQSDTGSYATFNSFFTRPLRADVRPVEEKPEELVFPSDGEISQLGIIKGDQIFQAKGHNYSLISLFAGNAELASIFTDGSFLTTYLSPGDYHRVHMPCNGTLRKMLYVPGSLYSVSPFAVKNIPNIFSRNERVVCVFDTLFGAMAQILVGANIVGSIETVWAGRVTPPRDGIIKSWSWPSSSESGEGSTPSFTKGQEMGRFQLGSTVITIFPKKSVEFNKELVMGRKIKFGSSLGQVL
jgi:phosphatidylserine decarboxylase